MLKVYKCEILKDFGFYKKGDIKTFFSYDYERFKADLKIIEERFLK